MKYAKAIVACLGAVGTWGATALLDDAITGAEWMGLLVALATALGVYGVSNKPAEDGERGHGGLDVLISLGVLIVLLALAWFIFERAS